MKVQIEFKLFCDLFRYFYAKQYEDGFEYGIESDIFKQLDSKMDKIVAHDLFTEYKRAPTPAEREAARKKYLDFREVQPSFRTDEEKRGL